MHEYILRAILRRDETKTLVALKNFTVPIAMLLSKITRPRPELSVASNDLSRKTNRAPVTGKRD